MNDVLGAGPDEAIEPPLTEDQLADLLQIRTAVLRRMRRRGQGPTYVECCGFVRYPRESIRRFLKVRRSRRKTPLVGNVLAEVETGNAEA
jgi:hypothetical protein